MKKTYIAPCTLVVNLRLSDTVLGDPGMGRASLVDGGEMDAKEQGGLWGDVDDDDSWSGSKGVDLWSGDDDEEEW